MSDPALPDAAILRVLHGRSRQPIGVAFLVDTDSGIRIVTCAHVLHEAEFTTFDGSRAVPAEPVDVVGDMASLQLLGPMPEGCATVPLLPASDPWDRRVRCFGFPSGHHDGVWATGRLLGKQGGGLLVVEDDRGSGFAIEQGFSGGPAWDPAAGAVVGMVVSVSARPERRTAFLVPSAVLLDRWPATTVVPPSPYRGLRSFDEEDSPLFFGRDELAEDIAAKVLTQPVVSLVGPSGRGKSSLIFAGVVPRLRERADLAIAAVRPRTDLRGAVAGALVDLLDPGLSETRRLAERPLLTEVIGAGRLGEVVERVLARTGHAALLVVVDQLEEALAQPDESLAAVSTLVDAAVAGVPIKVLLAIRSDFLDRALDHAALAAGLRSCETVGALTREHLLAAITGPLPDRIRLEDGLATRIVDDVVHAPGQLPLLQFALDKLWHKQNNGVLGHDAYRELGGVGGALARHADDIWSTLDADQQSIAGRLFTKLVRTAPDLPATRRAVRNTDLDDAERALAQRFVAEGLLVGARRDSVELAHEALITHWDRLRGWADDNREFELWRDALREDRTRRMPASLRKRVQSSRATPEAKRWLDARSADLLEDERGFARYLVLEARRYRQRWWRRPLKLLPLVLLVVLPFTPVPEQLVGLIPPTDPAEDAVKDYDNTSPLDEIRLMRSIAAYRSHNTPATREALFDSYYDSLGLEEVFTDPRPDANVDDLVVSGDAVVTRSGPGPVLWRPSGDRWNPTWLEVPSPQDIAVAQGGDLIAVSTEQEVVLFDGEGRELRRMTVPRDTTFPTRVAVTDNAVAAWRQNSDTIRVWTADGDVLAILPVPAADNEAWFAGDGNTLVVHNRTSAELSLQSVAGGAPQVVRAAVHSAGGDITGSTVIGCGTTEKAKRSFILRVANGGLVSEQTLDDRWCWMTAKVDRTGSYVATSTGRGAYVRDLRNQAGASTGPVGEFRWIEPASDGVRVFSTAGSSVIVEVVQFESMDNTVVQSHLAALHQGGLLALGRQGVRDQYELTLWNTAKRERLGRIVSDAGVNDLWFSPSADYLVVSRGSAQHLEIRRVPGLEVVANVPLNLPEREHEYTVRFDGDDLLIGHRGEIRTFALRTGAMVRRAPIPVPPETNGAVPFDVLDDGGVVAVRSDRHGIDEWDLSSAKPVAHHDFPGDPIVGVVAAPRGRLVVLARLQPDDRYRLELTDLGRPGGAVTELKGALSQMSRSEAEVARTVHRVVEFGPQHVIVTDGAIRRWDYHGVAAEPLWASLLIGTVRAQAGQQIVTDAGLITLDEEAWLRQLCRVVNHRDFTDAERERVPAGVQTTGLCPR